MKRTSFDHRSPRRPDHRRAFRRLSLALALALGLPASSSFAESAREPRPVSGIDRVVLRTVGDLEITQGSEEALVIEAEPRVLRRITTEVSQGTLTIDLRGSISTREPIRYLLRLKNASAIESTASGNVRATTLETDRLRLVQGGSGDLSIDALTAKGLTVDVSGAGSVRLGNGRVDQVAIHATGSGQFAAPRLPAREVRVVVDGSADVVVAVERSLDATVRGAGRVGYHGAPVVRQRIEGAGSVEREGG